MKLSITSKLLSSQLGVVLVALLEAIHRRYGYDFRGYSRPSLRRRIAHRLAKFGLGSVSEIQHRLLYDQPFFDELLLDLSLNVTSMFRDPAAYLALRNVVVPLLREEPHLRTWHAGCTTGEEVYSMATLLHEEGLLERARLYATDFNEWVLHRAREGVYPLDRVRDYGRSYREAGGKASLAEYLTTAASHAAIRNHLKQGIVFSDHNPATDSSFGQMHLIACRNVLIYFSRELQSRVVRLFLESLRPGGILWLGRKESVRFTDHGHAFEELVPGQRIYRKVAGTASGATGADR